MFNFTFLSVKQQTTVLKNHKLGVIHCLKGILKGKRSFQAGPEKCKNNVNRVYEEGSPSTDDTLSWEALVDYEKLSPLEKMIHRRHVQATKDGKLMYTDPETGYQVMTRFAHVQRGDCCGNACRHCPYNHKNVPEEKRIKIFNSAFYV